MSGRNKITLAAGLVVVLATIGVFAAARPEEYLSTSLGFGFLLYGEVVFFAGFVFVEYLAARSSQIMTRAGVGIPLEGYALIVIISSAVYMNLHSEHGGGFVILQIILAAAAAVSILAAAGASRSRYVQDSKTLQADAVVKGFIDELTVIKESSERKAEIDKLIEGMKYSDTSLMTDADVELKDAILKLKSIAKAEEWNEAEFEKCVTEIEFLIKKRSLQTRNARQGGI